MGGKKGAWAAGVLLLALGVPASVHAGPYFGDWGWCWKEGKDCPKGCYSPLHYCLPELYRVYYHCHPIDIDQYPPGLPVPVGWVADPFRCRAIPPMPTSPYADPEAFYGRPLLPTPEQIEAAKEKK
jgi:hypothetical protein